MSHNPFRVRPGRTIVGVAATACTLVFGTAAASAAGSDITYETAQPIQFAAGIQNAQPASEANALSCPTAGSCTAVGDFLNAAGEHEAFTVTSTDGVWSLAQPVRFPDGMQGSSPYSTLGSVDCTAPGDCTAAGWFSPPDSQPVAFTVTSTNGAWADPVPVSFDAGVALASWGSRFNDISCASAGNCAAVGYFANADGNVRALISTSTDGEWSKGFAVDFAAGAQADSNFLGTRLAAVDCTAVGACVAAGGFWSTKGIREAFTVTSTSGVWAQGQPATFADGVSSGNPDDAFNDISCSSTGNCTAVGYFASPAGVEAFSQTATSGTWADAVPAKFASGAQAATPNAAFNAVSCPANGNCTAVGSYTAPDNFVTSSVRPFGQTLTAGTWGTALPAVFASLDGTVHGVAGFDAVSCASAGNCTAAGHYVDITVNLGDPAAGLTQTMTNGVWANSVVSNFASDVRVLGSAGLSAISCSAPANCVSVGYYVPAGLASSPTRGNMPVGQRSDTPTIAFSQQMLVPLPATGANSLAATLLGCATLAAGLLVLGASQRARRVR